jgi:hypothetical protein
MKMNHEGAKETKEEKRGEERRREDHLVPSL